MCHGLSCPGGMAMSTHAEQHAAVRRTRMGSGPRLEDLPVRTSCLLDSTRFRASQGTNSLHQFTAALPSQYRASIWALTP